MPERTLHYFAVGGTGSLSVEPLLHLAAAGLGPDRLSVLVIDADAGNPALGRALNLLDLYDRVRRFFGNPSEGFFRTELIRVQRQHSFWSPLSNDTQHATGGSTLEMYAQRARMDGDLRGALSLFDLLFSPAQQREKLTEGFRGNPAIGSILMHGLKDAPLFRELVTSAKNDTPARFFATGSIFGGTGAAALPVIANLLASSGIDRSRLGAAVVTPYYTLGVPSADEARDGRLKPDAAKFMTATAAALPTYTRGQTRFGSLYVMGDDRSLPNPRKFSAGGTSQLNDPHFVELFAALAALDFAERAPGGIRYTSFRSDNPTWEDLPLSHEDSRGLRSFVLASNFFLQYFGARRTAADEQRLEGELRRFPWLQDIGLPQSFIRDHANELNALGDYFEAFWGWLFAVTHNSLPLQLVTFDAPSERRFRVPETYASGNETAALPILEQTLFGFNARRRGGIWHRGDPDRLDSLAQMFNWYNKVRVPTAHGLPGLLRYLERGSSEFVDEWYSAASEQQAMKL